MYFFQFYIGVFYWHKMRNVTIISDSVLKQPYKQTVNQQNESEDKG